MIDWSKLSVTDDGKRVVDPGVIRAVPVERSMCVVGIITAAAVCGVFWFVVGYLIGKF